MRGRRTIIVGQAPSRSGGPPLRGRVGRRIAALAGLTFDEYLLATERRNLLSTWPGKNGKGDAFPKEMARLAAESIEPRLAGRRVIFLGKLVAAAFDFAGEPLAWTDTGLWDASMVPHPSGINRWWNDAANVERAARFFGEALR